MRNQFQERILAIDEEMKKIDAVLGEFLDVISTDFNGIIGKTEMMKNNMTKIKMERSDAEAELKTFKEHLKNSFHQINAETNLNDLGLKVR